MDAITQQIIDGKFEYETGSLDLSSYKIELSIPKDGTTQGSFMISSHDGKSAKGTVMSTQMRMTCLTTRFEGERAEIFYSFSGKGMEEGDLQKGEFCIVSSKGEYSIPYMVSVEHGVLESSLGPVKNLFHFANLAKTDWNEAVALFYRPAFLSVFHDNDRQYLSTYLGLSKTRGNEQNVDEFLVEIKKKQQIEYLPIEDTIRLEEPNGVSEGKITITRNGWGYTALAIQTDGDFLIVEKKVLTDDDFLGNICSFSYCVDSSRLHAGNNYGFVRLYNSVFSTTIQIIVTRTQYKNPVLSIRREMKQLTMQLMEYYGAFRMKKIAAAIWLKESDKIVERMNSIDEKSIRARLFHAQLLITEERTNEAAWILDRVESELTYGKRKPENWCYYLYLTSLLRRGETYVNEVAREVEQIYARNPENWRIAWLLLYLREEFSKSPYKKWLFLEHQFYENCTSPVIYMEAVAILNVNPTMLMKLSEFELQVLNYAAKKDLLKRDLIIQIHALAAKAKNYSDRLLFILEKCYFVAEDDETLQIICSLLIKGNKADAKYFSWYSLGVERELRVTRLYEFYMMSMPENYDRELPKMVMMYFAYHSDLDYVKKAFLYANIWKHREKYPEIAQTYREAIELFVLDQIRKGHVNKELAYLYKEIVNQTMLQGEIALFFTPLLFSNLITVEVDGIRQVILIYDRLKGETAYPLVSGKTVVPIYGNDYQLLFQDDNGNRRIADVPYRIEKLMIPGRFIKELGSQVKSHLGLDLYLCESAKTGITITEKNVECFQRMWESDRIMPDFRKDIRLPLLQFYYEHDMIRAADSIMESVNAEDMGIRERAQLVQMMITRGMYDKAYSWLCQYGEELVDPSAVVRLLGRLIVRNEFKPETLLLRLSAHIFKKGKYDENTLRYLVAYYEGTTKDMRDIWKAAVDFGLESNDMCERILRQTLFTGLYIGEKNEMFYSYVRSGAKRDLELAFLTKSAYEYFVKGHIMEDQLFPYFTRLFYRGEEFQDICRLAYLRFYSQKVSEAGEEIVHLLVQFLEAFMKKGIYFPFFKEFHEISTAVESLMDRTMVEYRAAPESHVVLHYVIETDGNGGEYLTQPMQNMYEGIFVKSFVLFFGETLQYYITEEQGGREQLTESATISKSDTEAEGKETRFTYVNDLVIAKTLEDYPAFNKLLSEYDSRSYVVEKLFRISV